MRVRIKATKEEQEIEDSAFDASIHERIEDAGENVSVNLDTLRDVIKQVTAETVDARLKDAGVGEVDRSRVAMRPDGKVPAGSGARVQPAFASLYRTLPAWEQEIRTVDTDHWSQEWMLGMVAKDHGRMLRAHDEIAKLPGYARDLNTTDDSALVPSPLATTIVEKRRKVQVIGPRAQTFTSEATTMDVPVEASFATTSGVAEGGTITPDDPTFGRPTLTKKKSVTSTRASREFLEDNAFNAVNFLSSRAAQSMALYNDDQDMRLGDGMGTNQTDALEQNASITEVDAAVGVLVRSDVTALFYALLSQYRGNAVFMAPNDVLEILSNLAGTDGRGIFSSGAAPAEAISGGQGAPGVGSILQRPVIEVPATAGVLFFGDLQFYGVLEGGTIRAEVSEHASFLTDEIVWKWVQRRDGAVLQSEAFVKLGGITG